MTAADGGPALAALATEVADRLAGLRRTLEPTRELWAGTSAGLDPADEWTIAVDGLLGPDGVLDQISRAMDGAPDGAVDTAWPAFPGAGWKD
jgi:hypothetical protein